jgi:hypothetical protein
MAHSTNGWKNLKVNIVEKYILFIVGDEQTDEDGLIETCGGEMPR